MIRPPKDQALVIEEIEGLGLGFGVGVGSGWGWFWGSDCELGEEGGVFWGSAGSGSSEKTDLKKSIERERERES